MSDNDKLKDQIAQNAAGKQQRQFQLAFGITPHLPDLKTDFLSALTDYDNALASEPKPLLPEKAQPQRNEQPQEWTGEMLGWPRKALVLKHNVELAAERETTNRLVRLKDNLVIDCRNNKSEADIYYQQLLRAQATIERHNENCAPGVHGDGCPSIQIDFSLLHQHYKQVHDKAYLKGFNDASTQIYENPTEAQRQHDHEVCKPLVEALRKIMAYGGRSIIKTTDRSDIISISEDALSKFKESNAATVEGEK